MLWIAAASVAVIIVIVVIGKSRKPAADEAPPAPPPITHKVTLFNNGEVVKAIRATHAYASEGGGLAYGEGDQQYTMFGGCYVVERIDSPATAPRVPESKFRVTLYDGGKIVREWYASSAYGIKGGALLYATGTKHYTMIGGTYLVEPIT